MKINVNLESDADQKRTEGSPLLCENPLEQQEPTDNKVVIKTNRHWGTPRLPQHMTIERHVSTTGKDMFGRTTSIHTLTTDQIEVIEYPYVGIHALMVDLQVYDNTMPTFRLDKRTHEISLQEVFDATAMTALLTTEEREAKDRDRILRDEAELRHEELFGDDQSDETLFNLRLNVFPQFCRTERSLASSNWMKFTLFLGTGRLKTETASKTELTLGRRAPYLRLYDAALHVAEVTSIVTYQHENLFPSGHPDLEGADLVTGSKSRDFQDVPLNALHDFDAVVRKNEADRADDRTDSKPSSLKSHWSPADWNQDKLIGGTRVANCYNRLDMAEKPNIAKVLHLQNGMSIDCKLAFVLSGTHDVYSLDPLNYVDIEMSDEFRLSDGSNNHLERVHRSLRPVETVLSSLNSVSLDATTIELFLRASAGGFRRVDWKQQDNPTADAILHYGRVLSRDVDWALELSTTDLKPMKVECITSAHKQINIDPMYVDSYPALEECLAQVSSPIGISSESAHVFYRSCAVHLTHATSLKTKSESAENPKKKITLIPIFYGPARAEVVHTPTTRTLFRKGRIDYFFLHRQRENYDVQSASRKMGHLGKDGRTHIDFEAYAEVQREFNVWDRIQYFVPKYNLTVENLCTKFGFILDTISSIRNACVEQELLVRGEKVTRDYKVSMGTKITYTDHVESQRVQNYLSSDSLTIPLETREQLGASVMENLKLHPSMATVIDECLALPMVERNWNRSVAGVDGVTLINAQVSTNTELVIACLLEHFNTMNVCLYVIGEVKREEVKQRQLPVLRHMHFRRALTE